MNLLAAWLLTVAVHGTALLLAACLLERAFTTSRGAWRELLWRSALFGCVLTATLQLAIGQLPRDERGSVLAQPVQVSSTETSASFGPVHTAEAAAQNGAAESTARSSDAVPRAASAPFATMYTLPLLSEALPQWMVAGWLAGLLVALLRTSASLLRLRRALARSQALQRGELAQDLASLAQRIGIGTPRLLVLDAIPGPIAAHGRRIVLPAWAIGTLERAQLQAMLGHELAHVARRDPEWKLAVALWRALFWFVPLHALAQRRLDELAELACDAHAARYLGDGHGLAECLAVCAEHHVRRHEFSLATAMAARRSSLLFRIERLLEGASMETSTAGVRARLLSVAVLVACSVGLPAIGFDAGLAHAAQKTLQDGAPPAKVKRDSGTHSSITIHSDGGNGRDTMTVSISDDAYKFRANVEGKIGFNNAETDIVSLAPDGTARLEETRGGITQRIEVSVRGDKLERRYFVGDVEHPYDDTARALMAVAVKQLMRTGVDAEARANGLYARGGANGVLDEIEQIHSDYVRGIYLGVLLRRGKLAPAELDRALSFAGAMDSDYECQQALAALFDTQALDAAHQVTFLHLLNQFSGDFERAELLVSVVPKLADAASVRQAWFDAALGVQSDFERQRAMQAMLMHGGLDDAQLGSVIEASASMRSDFEHRELLVETARRIHDVDAVALAYTHSAQSLQSDYERREALLALIRAGKLGAKSADAVLDSAAQIKSGDECREVLVALARVMPDDSALIAHYRAVSAHLPESERGEAERALAR